jgi:hypothetical protein
MLLSTVQATNSQLPQLTVSPESIMYSQVPAQLYYKAMKMKYLKSSSTLKEIKSSLQVAIKLVVYGTQILAKNYKC